jgi:hypothetical protein
MALSLMIVRSAIAAMTRPARFSQADLTRAVRAFEKAGLCVAGAKINPATGEITVLTGTGGAANDVGNPLDRLLGQ